MMDADTPGLEQYILYSLPTGNELASSDDPHLLVEIGNSFGKPWGLVNGDFLNIMAPVMDAIPEGVSAHDNL